MKRASNLEPPLTWRRADVLTSSVTTNLLALAMPFVILQVYDRILPNHAYSTLALLIGSLIGVTLTDMLVKACRSAIMSAAGVRFEHQKGVEAFDNILAADLPDYTMRPTDQYAGGFRALGSVRDFHAGQSAELTADLPFAVLFLLLIWFIAGSLVLVPIVILALFGLTTLWTSRHLKKALGDRRADDERRSSFLTETLTGIHTLKSMAMEQSMQRRYERLEFSSAVAVRDLTLAHGLALSAGYFFAQFAVVCVVVIGAIYVVESNLTMGGLAACTMLTGRSLRPVLKGMSYWNAIQNQQIKHQQAEMLFNIKPEFQLDHPRRAQITGHIALRDVSVHFEDTDKPILANLTLDIKPGEMIGIVGNTGCGRTSFLRLFNGTVNPASGDILFDGHSAREFDPQALRQQIGFMSNTGDIFEGTILENITMFQDGEAKIKAVAAIRKLGLSEYISRLPNGLDTQLSGTRADRIPGGIKQRMVLARTLVNPSRVLLFDNANIGLDAASDGQLLTVFANLKGKQTVIVASQRPSYLRLCDRIFELKGGSLTPWELPAYSADKPSQSADVGPSASAHRPEREAYS